MINIKNISKYRMEIMGVATIWVFLLHKWILIFSEIPVIGSIEKIIRNLGACGVDVFLFLSGIGLYYSFSKNNDIKLFYYKRIKRILFPYYARVFLAYGFSFAFIKEIIGYDFWFMSLWASPVWYYHAIFVLYTLFPFLYIYFSKLRNKKMFLLQSYVMIAVFGILRIMGFLREDIFFFIYRIPIFLVGIYFGYLLYEKKVVKKEKLLIIIFTSFVLSLLMYSQYTKMIEFEMILYFFLTVFVSICLSQLFEITKGSGLLRFIGKYSYEVYLLQLCIDPSRFYKILPTGLATIALFVAVLIAAIILNYINKYLWILIEYVYKKVMKKDLCQN